MRDRKRTFCIRDGGTIIADNLHSLAEARSELRSYQVNASISSDTLSIHDATTGELVLASCVKKPKSSRNRFVDSKPIYASEGRDSYLDEGEDDYDMQDQIDDIADDIDDLQDDIDDIQDDDVNIEIENNISNAYIAECDRCHGIFISAVKESDQQIDHISGICPICNRDTDQILKWIVRDIDFDENDETSV